MKKYKAIFFDWDGTAVISRNAPIDDIIPLMANLLTNGIILVVISGTTYENIAHGQLHKYLPKEALQNLYLGLARGAYNYTFSIVGKPILKFEEKINLQKLLTMHSIAFEVHQLLLSTYQYPTDIVFSRPNYCKIDLLVEHDRMGELYLHPEEIQSLNQALSEHGYKGGIQELIEEVIGIGRKHGIPLKVTTDAKYLEIGLTTKADNVDYFLKEIILKKSIPINDCCFWGDEFALLGAGVYGSDALMITEISKTGDFFDVSSQSKQLPEQVVSLGGGVPRFLSFLKDQLI